MLKVIALLCLCTSMNCVKFKCDYKKIMDLRSANATDEDRLHDKDVFCKNKICVFRLCSQPHRMMILNKNKNGRCAPLNEIAMLTNKSTEVPVYKMDNSSNFFLSEKKIGDFQFIVYKDFKKMNKENCFSKLLTKDLRLLEDGSLSMSNEIISGPLGFAVEFRMTQQGNGEWVGPHLVARILRSEKYDETIAAKEIYDIIGMITSCVFLILVLVVYSLLKQLQGQYVKIFMAYIACLAITYALTATLRLGLDFDVLNSFGCKWISSFMYFFVLATYFWLNVIAYEIWNAFRPKNEFRPRRSRDSNHKFLRASLYAFGMPLIMLVGVIILDEVDLTRVKPNLGGCMYSKSPLFHYIPITIILCVNLVFFAMTTYHFCWKKMGKTLNSSESRMSRRDRNNFRLYIKLTASTGLDWFLDVIDMYVELPAYVNYVIDAYTLYLGVILFIVLCVCNKNVLSLLSKRFNINNRFANQSSMNSTNTSQSGNKRRNSNHNNRNKSNSIEPNSK